MKPHHLKICLTASLLCWTAAAQAGGSTQIVNAKNAIVNSAQSGGTATMNISSNKGVPVPAGNKQITQVNGPILNAAGPGGHAELNIASRTPKGSSGAQVISINGPVVNQASGGQTSIMNIGSSR